MKGLAFGEQSDKNLSGIIILNFIPVRSEYKDVGLPPASMAPKAGDRILKV